MLASFYYLAETTPYYPDPCSVMCSVMTNYTDCEYYTNYIMDDKRICIEKKKIQFSRLVFNECKHKF